MIIDFSYNYGKGRLKIDLSQVLPATAQNMNRLIDFFNLAADMEPAETVYSYIAERINALQAAREQESEKTAAGRKNICKINADIKKYINNAAALAKCFGFDPITDQAATIKMKSGKVYAFQHERGKGATIKEYAGYSFEKAGYVFDVYKAGKGMYSVLMHGTGLQVASCTNRNSAPAEITKELLDLFKKNASKIAACKAQFEKVYAKCFGDQEIEQDQETEQKAAAQHTETREQESRNVEQKAADPGQTGAESGKSDNVNEQAAEQTFDKEKRPIDGPRGETEKGAIINHDTESPAAGGRPEPETANNESERKEPETMKTEYSITPAGIITAFIDGKPAETIRPGETGYTEMLQKANAERRENGKPEFTIYEYGMRLRGFAPACQPMDGFIYRRDNTGTGRKYHDIIAYSRPLTDQEISGYELDPIPAETGSAETGSAETDQETERAENISNEQERAENISNQAGNDQKRAGNVPEKTFIGETITGGNWKILFDPETQRTRVFLDNGSEKQKNAITAAGFWWSGAMNSYNKKLTFKAYRAAKQLAETLCKLAG